ncbi:hypothetical protein ACFOZ0_05690 [Streptomyces yaanensis]|uniref:Secreted protein n=1 Tax=Streptomyces yaanensis TaxID=1142239 RepID=A0ABV7S765_9ACTN|nr:hypothetical protein [Streptomyces sp. CGMCC 4.7035]WNC02307.1 hypothetical protein Q2K21_31955 [Streptomyces sp. CGMCC 4.7035]
MPIALLLTTSATAGVGVAVLCAVRALGRQVATLRTELAESRAAQARGLVPAARSTADAEEIRAAVSDALAEERERELAEARAFWAAQEARDIADAPTLLGLPDNDLFLPRQSDFAGLEHDSLEPVAEPTSDENEFAGDSPELAAARRRHPSHPDFVPVASPVVNDHERTVACLEELAAARTELADVRPGPLGTLDVYVFADGTTLCMTPGHRETAERLASALSAGHAPVLLGGSGVSGAYALTFTCGDETVYILADRVIASL